MESNIQSTATQSCTNCGALVPLNIAFCGECGKPLSNNTEKENQNSSSGKRSLSKNLIWAIIGVIIILTFIFAKGTFQSKIIFVPVMIAIALLISIPLRFFGANYWKSFKIITLIVLLIGLIFGYEPDNHSNSSSSSSGSHTCMQCGKSYSGNGWSTVGGEQFQPTDSDGGYCSKSCAYNSQPSRWKK